MGDDDGPFLRSSILRSATTEAISFAALIRSIPSLVTCMPLRLGQGSRRYNSILNRYGTSPPSRPPSLSY